VLIKNIEIRIHNYYYKNHAKHIKKRLIAKTFGC